MPNHSIDGPEAIAYLYRKPGEILEDDEYRYRVLTTGVLVYQDNKFGEWKWANGVKGNRPAKNFSDLSKRFRKVKDEHS
jgi:hypothetical protein